MSITRFRFLIAVAAAWQIFGCAPREQSDAFSVRPVERATTTESRAGDERVPLSVEVRSEIPSAAALIGKRCRVRFRRDALGVAGTAYVEPTADHVSGRPLFVEGILERITLDAVVLHNGEQVIWIPAGNVLIVETVP